MKTLKSKNPIKSTIKRANRYGIREKQKVKFT